MRYIGYLLLLLTASLISTNKPQLSEQVIDLNRPLAVNLVLHGQQAHDFYGSDLAAGDVSGDGIDDVIIGAYLADGPRNARNGAGEDNPHKQPRVDSHDPSRPAAGST